MKIRDEKLAVANTGSDSVTIIDREKCLKEDTFFMREGKCCLGPHQILRNEKEDIFYATNSYDNSVYKIDIINKSIIDTLVVGCFPSHIERLDDFLIVSNSDSNSISIIKENDFTLIEDISVGERPHDVKVDDRTKKIYAANSNNYTISVISIYDNEIQELKLEYKPLHLFIGEKKIYVLCPLSNGMTNSKILILDIDSYEVVTSIDVEGVAIDMIVLEDRQEIYCTNIENGYLYKFKINEKDNFEKYYIGGMPNNLLLDKNLIFITNVLNDILHVFDYEKKEIIKNINTGIEPSGLLMF